MKKKGKGKGDLLIKICGWIGDFFVLNIVEGISDEFCGGGKIGCGCWNYLVVCFCV